MHLKLVKNGRVSTGTSTRSSLQLTTPPQADQPAEPDTQEAPCFSHTLTEPAAHPTVVDGAELKSKRFWREFKERTQYVDLDINYGDITRYYDEATGSSGADELSYGKEAKKQVREIFNRYRLPMPATYAELRANHLFLERVEQARHTLLLYAPRQYELGLSTLKTVYRSVEPEVLAYLRDGLDGLVKHLRIHRTFKRNARVYDESEELRWLESLRHAVDRGTDSLIVRPS